VKTLFNSNAFLIFICTIQHETHYYLSILRFMVKPFLRSFLTIFPYYFFHSLIIEHFLMHNYLQSNIFTCEILHFLFTFTIFRPLLIKDIFQASQTVFHALNSFWNREQHQLKPVFKLELFL